MRCTGCNQISYTIDEDSVHALCVCTVCEVATIYYKDTNEIRFQRKIDDDWMKLLYNKIEKRKYEAGYTSVW